MEYRTLAHLFLSLFEVVTKTIKCRKSRSQMFFEIGVLKNISNFTGKNLKACNFIKKRLQHKCFPIKFEKFLRTPFFYRAPLMATSANERTGFY